MTLIAIIGDCATTTTLALASAFPADDEVLVVEADPGGGSVAAWLDTSVAPSLSTVVASVGAAEGDTAGTWAQIETLIRRSRSGIRFIPAPVRSIEATQAIGEAVRVVLPTIARRSLALVDGGRRAVADGAPTVTRLADTIIVCHRQATASAAAAAVRLERTAELLELLSTSAGRVIVAVIGDEPFELSEIHDYLQNGLSTTIETHQLAVDELAAAVLGGRQGVSTRRYSRLPLVRDCAALAALISAVPDEGPAER